MEEKICFGKNTGVGQIYDNAILRCPDRTAIVSGDWRISYREFGELINKSANFLLSVGVKKGDRVALISRNCPELLILDMAIHKVGAICVKFNWRLAPEEMGYLITLNDIAYCFFKPERKDWGDELIAQYKGEVRFYSLFEVDGRSCLYSLLKDMPATPVETVMADDDVAFHLHTSGTTGKPKCVVYSVSHFLRELESMDKVLKFYDGMVYQFVSQLFHSASAGAYLVLAHGGTLVLMSQFTVKEYVDSLIREKVNAIGVVPLVLKGILDEADSRQCELPDLHVINYSTCPISPDLLDRAIAKLNNCEFYQTYGMTEMASAVTVLTAEDHFIDGGKHLRSVGRPIPGAEVKILRDDGTECAPNEDGEIVVRGPGMMSEYYNLPEVTASVIVDGWYHTKDAGCVDDKGYVYIHGRKDSLIISGGENIYPEEISNVILKMPEVFEVAVYGMPDEKWGEHVKASIVLAPGKSLSADEIKTFCRAHMPGFRIPKEIEFLDELPKNATGKVIIAQLKNRK